MGLVPSDVFKRLYMSSHPLHIDCQSAKPTHLAVLYLVKHDPNLRYLSMHTFFRLSVISLLAVAALSNAQAPNLSPQQQILNNAVAALASLQAQIPNNLAVLQTLAGSGILGSNAQLASQNSNLIAQLQALPQLVRDESAALLQLKLPTSSSPAISSAPVSSQPPAAPPVSSPPPAAPPVSSSPPAASNPASLQNQCVAVQRQLQIYTAVVAASRSFVTVTGGAPVFSKSVNDLQSAFSCQGVNTGACQAVNELVARLQAYAIQFPEQIVTALTDPPVGQRNGIIAAQVSTSAKAVLGLIAKLKTALKCP